MNNFELDLNEKWLIVNNEISTIYALQNLLHETLLYNEDNCNNSSQYKVLVEILLEHTKNITCLF